MTVLWGEVRIKKRKLLSKLCFIILMKPIYSQYYATYNVTCRRKDILSDVS